MQRLAVAVIGLLVVLLRTSANAPASAAQRPRLAEESLIIIDGHEHITNRAYFEGIDPWKAQPAGVWDYAKAKQGGVGAVIENIWADDGYNNYDVTVKQVCRLMEIFYRVLDANRDKMALALTSSDVRRIVGEGKLAVILGIEAGFDMEGDVDVLRLFHRMGVRLVQFTNHDTTNTYVDALGGEKKWNGINDRGRALIREMNRLGIIIDVSHATPQAQLQIIEASHAPVTNSHSGLLHFVNNPRNTSDDVLKALAAKGGLMGMHSSAITVSQSYYDWSRRLPQRPEPLPNMFRSPDKDYGEYINKLDAEIKRRWLARYSKPWKELSPDEAPEPTIEEWAAQVDYAVKLVGADHIGIGFDASRGGGYLRDFDATQFPHIVKALRERGYNGESLRKILGGNWLRLLDQARVPSLQSHSGH